MVDSLRYELDGSRGDYHPKDRSPERAREVEAIMRLHCIPRVGTRTLWRILERFGFRVAALEAQPAQLDARVGSRGAAAAPKAPVLHDHVERAMKRCIGSDMRVLTWRDGEYPGRLLNLTDPPAPLFYRGDPGLVLDLAVTVAGSRRSTPYGRRMAERLAAELSKWRIVVVSGLALGIDGAAHRGALEAGGDTIAVPGSGVDLIQPSSHRALGRRIAGGVSCCPSFCPERPLRLIIFCGGIVSSRHSGGGAVVVVEAGERSGAFITVEHALDLGRDVYAVPGPVDSLMSRGCNTLLQQGAQVVSSVSDFVRELEFPHAGVLGEGCVEPGGCGIRPTSGASPPERSDEPRQLTPVARRVWGALDDRPVRIAEVVQLSRLDSGSTLVIPTELEMAGWVAKEAGMRFRKAS